VAQGASGIGSWTGVMELIAMVSIPINLAIILFTGKGEDEDGDFGYSETVLYLLGKDEKSSTRTIFEVVLILILVEHVLLAFKVIMATLIPDVPKEVEDEERKRPKLEEIAEKEIFELKRSAQAHTILEIMETISKEDRDKRTRELEELEEHERMENVDPDANAAKKRRKALLNEDIQEVQEKAMEQ